MGTLYIEYIRSLYSVDVVHLGKKRRKRYAMFRDVQTEEEFSLFTLTEFDPFVNEMGFPNTCFVREPKKKGSIYFTGLGNLQTWLFDENVPKSDILDYKCEFPELFI